MLKFKSNVSIAFDAELERLLSYLSEVAPGTEEYTIVADRIAQLSESRNKAAPKDIDPNTIAGGVFSIATVFAILKHEKLNVIATKAIGFVPKLKL